MMVVLSGDINQLISEWSEKYIAPLKLTLTTAEASQVYDIFKTDFARYYDGDVTRERLFHRAELQGILLYRIARLCYLKGDSLCEQLGALGRFLSAFEMYYSAEIGEGFKVNHGMGMVIGARSKVGKNALFHHNVTLGDRQNGRPTLLDHVTVYPGASILGDITIGNHVVVGANAVCTTSVPDGKIVGGIPARILK